MTVVLVAAFFFFLDPFRLFDRGSRVPRLPVSRAETTELVESYRSTRRPAGEYVAGLFDRFSVVLIGETGNIRQHVEVAAEIVPAIFDRGIRAYAVAFLRSADQDDIDDLLTAETFDEALAHELLFRRLVLNGYEEYVDVLRGVWTVNIARSPGTEPMRVLGLAGREDYTHIRTEADARDPEVVRRVLLDGLQDEHAASVLIRAAERGERIAAYVGFESAWTRVSNPEYATRVEEQGFTETRRAGRIVADRLGNDRVATVLLHAPWPDDRAQLLVGYPAGGRVDEVLRTVGPGEQAGGFDVRGTPFGSVRIASGDYRRLQDDLTFGDMADGYIVNGPINEYTGLTPIPDFITAENLAEALRRFPGPDPGDVSAADLNRYMSEMATGFARRFEEFR